MTSAYSRGVALAVTTLFLFACATSAKTIESGAVSRIVFDNWKGPAIPVWTYVPAAVDSTNAPILILMHGMKRNPARYLRQW